MCWWQEHVGARVRAAEGKSVQLLCFLGQVGRVVTCTEAGPHLTGSSSADQSVH